MDKILDEFEQQQIEEAANPKPKVEKKTPRTPRPRRKRELVHDDEEIEYPIELETTRSGIKTALKSINRTCNTVRQPR